MNNTTKSRKLLGDNIRYFRRKADLSQEDLALSADLTKGFLGRVERGLDNIGGDAIFRIANALGIEPYLLFVTELHRSKVMAEREKE